MIAFSSRTWITSSDIKTKQTLNTAAGIPISSPSMLLTCTSHHHLNETTCSTAKGLWLFFTTHHIMQLHSSSLLLLFSKFDCSSSFSGTVFVLHHFQKWVTVSKPRLQIQVLITVLKWTVQPFPKRLIQTLLMGVLCKGFGSGSVLTKRPQTDDSVNQLLTAVKLMIVLSGILWYSNS